jgi:hypothetical protein
MNFSSLYLSSQALSTAALRTVAFWKGGCVFVAAIILAEFLSLRWGPKNSSLSNADFKQLNFV